MLQIMTKTLIKNLRIHRIFKNKWKEPFFGLVKINKDIANGLFLKAIFLKDMDWGVVEP